MFIYTRGRPIVLRSQNQPAYSSPHFSVSGVSFYPAIESRRSALVSLIRGSSHHIYLSILSGDEPAALLRNTQTHIRECRRPAQHPHRRTENSTGMCITLHTTRVTFHFYTPHCFSLSSPCAKTSSAEHWSGYSLGSGAPETAAAGQQRCTGYIYICILFIIVSLRRGREASVLALAQR